MESQPNSHFNDQLRARSLDMAAGIFELFRSREAGQIVRPIITQIIRSSSSVAANFRAATRARSDAEFYAKICIVAEECDETQFCLDYLIRINVVPAGDCVALGREIDEEVRIFSAIKRKMKDRIAMAGKRNVKCYMLNAICEMARWQDGGAPQSLAISHLTPQI
jgi:four helix bundle protein